MPTDPLQSVLYREFAKAQAKDIAKEATPLLQELVNYGSNALIRCATSSKGNENEDLAATSLYRHILEMVDAIEVLLYQGCADPATPLLRSLFEAMLSLEYILESDDTYIARSLAWLANYIRNRINGYEMLIPTTSRGAQFRASLAKDKTISHFDFPPSDEIQKAIDNLQSLLSSAQFATVEEEFHIARKRSRSTPEWYSLFGGPRSVKGLADYLRRNAGYDVLYRQWSAVAHATDFSQFIGRGNEGQSGIRGIRYPRNLIEVANFTAVFMLEATRLMIKKFRPGESFADYYRKEIRDLFLKLNARRSRKS